MPESEDGKLVRRMKEHPEFPVGIVGCVMVLAYGAYKYKYRGDMSTSLYLMRLRVMAQGAVVSCLCVGLCMQLGKKLYNHMQVNKEER